MKAGAWILLLLCLWATFFTPVKAQDDAEVEVTEEEEAVEDAYDEFDVHEISVKHYIPEFNDNKFPVGQPVTILIDFANNGQDVYNITGVAAYLHSPFDLNYYIQNFTAKELSGVAAPGSQISLEYKVTPDAKLEPLEFWLSGFVEYTVEGSDERFRQTFVNTTVDLFETKSSFDISSIFSTLSLMGVLGAGAYFGMTLGASKVAGKKLRKRYTGAKKSAEADWDVDMYQQSDKSRTARRGKKISKK